MLSFGTGQEDVGVPQGLKSLRENSTYEVSPKGTAESQSCPNYRIGRPCSVDFIGQASAATAPSEMRLGVRA